jgi:hypothetical protein
MAYVKFARAWVLTGIDTDDTSLVLRQGHGAHFDDGNPTNTFYAVIWDTSYYSSPEEAYENSAAEVVSAVYTSGSDTLTITRAQDGTTARSFNSSGHTYEIYMTLTAAQTNALLALL